MIEKQVTSKLHKPRKREPDYLWLSQYSFNQFPKLQNKFIYHPSSAVNMWGNIFHCSWH